jgi:hypothetical protein
MSEENPNAEADPNLATVLGNAVAYVTNEALILAQFELFLQDDVPTLWQEDQHERFSAKLDQICIRLGGPPKAVLLMEGEAPPIYDFYASAALQEAIAVFYRARKSVTRAHMFMTGSRVLYEHPEIMELPDDDDASGMLKRGAVSAFWEHAEAAYIRLASYWDRIGQVFDFAFFNIRQFERDGFSAVMDRIHSNAVPMDSALARRTYWKDLRAFQTSEKDDGLKWLLRRRNIVVHSLHLHPLSDKEDEVFKSQYNHLEAAHRNRLVPRSPDDEVAQLYSHLAAASAHFWGILEILEHAPRRDKRK